MPRGGKVVGHRTDRAEDEGFGACKVSEQHASRRGVLFNRPALTANSNSTNSPRNAMSVIIDITSRTAIEPRVGTADPLLNDAPVDDVAALRDGIGLAGAGAQLLEDADRQKTDIEVLLVEVENVRELSDRLGQCAADASLLVVARVLFVAFRQQDVLARIGPTTFLVLAPGLDRYERATLTSRIRSNLASPDTVAFVGAPIKVSIGWATRKPADDSWVGDLVRRSDRPVPSARAGQMRTPIPHLQILSSEPVLAELA